jgi:hypothetical protein
MDVVLERHVVQFGIPRHGKRGFEFVSFFKEQKLQPKTITYP